MLYTPMLAIHGEMANTRPVEMTLRMKTTEVRASPRICQRQESIPLVVTVKDRQNTEGGHGGRTCILVTILDVRQSDVAGAADRKADEGRANSVDDPWHTL